VTEAADSGTDGDAEGDGGDDGKRLEVGVAKRRRVAASSVIELLAVHPALHGGSARGRDCSTSHGSDIARGR
jgi:hypothetical protein